MKQVLGRDVLEPLRFHRSAEEIDCAEVVGMVVRISDFSIGAMMPEMVVEQICQRVHAPGVGTIWTCPDTEQENDKPEINQVRYMAAIFIYRGYVLIV